LENSNYNETGKKSRAKLLELYVKQKLASSSAQAVEVTTTDSPPYHPANEARSRHAALTLSVDLLENINFVTTQNKDFIFILAWKCAIARKFVTEG